MIGTKYEKTVERLKEKIKNNLIRVIERKAFNSKFKSNFACYFCRKKINVKVRFLTDENSNGEGDYYPIDSKCYAKAKGMEVV